MRCHELYDVTNSLTYRGPQNHIFRAHGTECGCLSSELDINVTDHMMSPPPSCTENLKIVHFERAVKNAIVAHELYL